jgi:hypothetical protein
MVGQCRRALAGPTASALESRRRESRREVRDQPCDVTCQLFRARTRPANPANCPCPAPAGIDTGQSALPMHRRTHNVPSGRVSSQPSPIASPRVTAARVVKRTEGPQRSVIGESDRLGDRPRAPAVTGMGAAGSWPQSPKIAKFDRPAKPRTILRPGPHEEPLPTVPARSS